MDIGGSLGQDIELEGFKDWHDSVSEVDEELLVLFWGLFGVFF